MTSPASRLILPLLGSCAAACAFSPVEARLELAGTWKGKLEYLDYTSKRWFAIPQQRTIELLPGGHATLETGKFDDGPAGTVYIHTVSAFEKDGVTLCASSFRKGRDMALLKESVVFGAGENRPGSWTLVHSSEAMDDNRPARLRTTLTFSGSAYTTLKEVDFSDDDKDEWIVRNRSSLTRQD